MSSANRMVDLVGVRFVNGKQETKSFNNIKEFKKWLGDNNGSITGVVIKKTRYNYFYVKGKRVYNNSFFASFLKG